MACYQKTYTCDICDEQLRDEKNLLYKFKGCGKYHNKKLCNICFQNKFGYTIKGDLDLSTGVNDDPLGMKIIIYKKL